MDGGHAGSTEACNAHYKELLFPILTQTRALPHFYFTQHYDKLVETTLYLDIIYIQTLYNMFTQALFALPDQITKMFTELADNATALPMLNQQIIHLNTLVQNLSWNILELEELLAPNIAPRDDMATSTPPTHTTDTQPNSPHDDMI